jgi:ABC-type antimicrobial peptide transport system permease subunit
MALGATSGQIVREVLGRGLGLVAVGVGLGIIGFVVSSQALRSLLFGVEPFDPMTMVVVVALIFIVAILACYIPARRIYRLDPGVALRYE